MKFTVFCLVIAATAARPTWVTGNATCQASGCTNQAAPCLDFDSGECLPRTDPTYNVTSGQCRAGTLDCCCTSQCCCLLDLPCMQMNDKKCMPKVDQIGAFCPYDPVKGYAANCSCSAGTQECNEDPRSCPIAPTPVPTPPPTPPPTPKPTPPPTPKPTPPPTPPPTPKPTPPPTPKPTPAPTPCDKPLDIAFLVDDSGSIGSLNFHLMKQNMQQIVTGLDISPTKVHVSAYTFDDCMSIEERKDPKEQGIFDDDFFGGECKDIKKCHHSGFGLTQYTSQAGVSQAIGNLQYNEGGTCTGKAITWDMQNVLTPSAGARSQIPPVMVIITDGKPDDEVKAPSSAARAAGVKVFAIGVGGTYDLSSLQTMASQPYSDYVYTLKNFDVAQFKAKLIQIACGNNTVTH